jgi:hypothetical protein
VKRLHDLTVSMEGPGRGVLILDGLKLSATEYSIQAGVGEVTKLTVTVYVGTVNGAEAGAVDVTNIGDSTRQYARPSA